jgi:dipeptidase
MMSEKISSQVLSCAVALGLVALFGAAVARADGCYTIVVGKNASADGYVIMAHNEDDAAPQIVNHHKVPRMKHSPAEKVNLLFSGEVDQVEETWAYIWSEMPGMMFSDSYVNEWGLCIASDACPSREDRPEISDGGISYMLRRLVAQRAKTAREGVLIAAELVERFGYEACGRTYIISDPDEGWLFCAVGGKYWLSQKVSDNEVAVLANTFTVHQVDLADPDRFLASADIINYAVSRGWYDPETKTPFDFAVAYADSQAASDSSNFCRQWAGLRHIARDPIPLGEALPFSVVPKHKLDVASVMQIMRDHYEGTELYQISTRTGSPHQTGLNTICNGTTQTSFVVQLRRNVPLDVGVAYWVCLAPPCASCYLPFHFGITSFPAGFSDRGEQPSGDFYLRQVQAPFQGDPFEAFWTFSNFHHTVVGDYGNKITGVRVVVEEVETRALTLQKPLEQAALELYPVDKTTALAMLANYSNGIYLSAVEAMVRVLAERR